jgi:hypothetical protein
MFWVGVVALLGCGNVKKPPDLAEDAPSDDAVTNDVAGCTVHDTIESCGASCTSCPPAADDRQVPICSGTACETACVNAAPRCTDNSCSRLVWAFDSNTIDGIIPRAPAGLRMAVRNHGGSLALAVDVTNLTEVSFIVPICKTGNLQLQTKTLSTTVFFEGGDPVGNNFYVQASTPSPRTGAYLVNKSLPAGISVVISAPMSMSQFANMATDVVFQAGTATAQFSGTIWFDDIKIQ